MGMSTHMVSTSHVSTPGKCRATHTHEVGLNQKTKMPSTLLHNQVNFFMLTPLLSPKPSPSLQTFQKSTKIHQKIGKSRRTLAIFF